MSQHELEDRCEATTSEGRCPNRKLGGSAYCKPCRNKKRNPEPRQYQLNNARFRQRQGEFGEHEALLSLRDEIALVKILIEERYNLIKNDSDLMVACGPLNTLFLTLERLVKSCNSLEKSLGNLLSKSALITFAGEVITIVADEISHLPEYEELVDRISDRLIEATVNTKNVESE